MGYDEIHPSLKFEMDETMVQTSSRASNYSRAVIPKSAKFGTVLEDETSRHVTLVACISADGAYAPPMCIFPLKYLPQGLSENSIVTAVSGSDNGWMTTAILLQWVKKVFIPFVQSVRHKFNLQGYRASLQLDGHTSRFNPEAWQLCADANIVVVSYPAHATHLLSALDKLIFSSFKYRLLSHSSKFDDLSEESIWAKITHEVRDAFHFACSPDNIEAAFRAVGAVPLNSAVVLQGGIPLRKGHALPKQRKALNINEEVLSQAEFIQVMRAERKRLEAKGRKKKVKGRRGIHSQEEEREESENDTMETFSTFSVLT